ncbi:RmlC-like cupin domain-containing protein [Mycena olivaceomarginata]|nr:RmlC-like cupin domain-containing protein [Mycena olivaceomarginata]
MSVPGRYSSFYDPFAKGNVVPASDVFPEAKALSFLHVDAPPPYATLKRVLNIVSAKAVSQPEANGSDSLTYNASTNLGIHGQGTVIANCTSPTGLLFSFSTEDNSKSSLYAQITEFAVDLWHGPTAPVGSTGYVPPDRVSIQGSVVNEPPNAPTRTFLRPEIPGPARYWISVDHKNGILRFGRDYVNLAFVLYEARLKQKVDPGVWHWIDEKYAFIDHLTTVNVQQRGGNLTARPLQLVSLPLPVVQKPPPVIVPSASITLDQIAMGSATVPANLSAECQVLYANVAGPNIILDTPDFPEFSQAIERSTLLKKKASEFGKEDYMSTYLRITLGADLGNSPGPPYVLEIWPALHASPIHNHGDSHGVIKVLHGKIKAYYFTSLYDAQPIGPPANLEKGDITWIDPENYQVHQLSNESRDGSVCCTIQCYSYGAKDVRHYEAFDYVNEATHKVVEQFEPNSDMRYDEFKAALKQEWSRRWEQVSKA